MFNFCDIVGNDSLKQSLIKSLKQGKVNHAYIFDGPNKMGKKLIATTFAKGILCDKNGCDECTCCNTVNSGNNPDLIYVKKTKATIGVDDIRDQVINNAQIKPFNNKYKVFIIEDANLMTVQAQNALLKTLEQPYEYAVFLLLSTNYNMFLPTILSRCILYRLKPLKQNLISDYLVKYENLDYDKARLIASYSSGNLGYALSVSKDEEFSDLLNYVNEIIIKIENYDFSQLFELTEFFENNKDRINEILDILSLIYRDCIVYNKNKNLLIQKDNSVVSDLAERLDEISLLKNIDVINKTKEKLKQNTVFTSTIEVMLIELKEKKL